MNPFVFCTYQKKKKDSYPAGGYSDAAVPAIKVNEQCEMGAECVPPPPPERGGKCARPFITAIRKHPVRDRLDLRQDSASPSSNSPAHIDGALSLINNRA